MYCKLIYYDIEYFQRGDFMNKKSQKPISIRLADEVAEKFRTYSQNYAKSQSDLIEMLLRRFDDTKDMYPSVNNENDLERDIWVYTSYLNLFIKDKARQYKTMKKYLVKGHSVYWYPDGNAHLPLYADSYSCVDELKKEFDIKEDLKNYKFCFWFWVLWDNTQNKYLLLEKFSLIETSEKNEEIIKLYVDRCKHFAQIKEIRECIKVFSTPQQLMQFDRQNAETITADELKEYWY